LTEEAVHPVVTKHQGRWPKAALIIGHPGHELRVLGWVRAAKPLVAILTDGSGAGGAARIDQTTQLLNDVMHRSASYGVASDREVYRAILEQDLDYFLALSSRLADELCEHRIECVAGDSIEGYNPTHDLCSLLIDRAVRLASDRMDVAVRHYAFPLLGSPRPDGLSADYQCLRLTPDELVLKLASIRQYAQSAGGVLVTEIDDLLDRFGEQAFAEEVFDRVDIAAALSAFDDAKPFYETYGEQQVTAGKYRFVIRYREHIAPIARALADKASP
jgi:hypothetical protein